MEDEKLKKDILLRLRKIEGQVKGIQGMIDKNTCCDDVLVQIAAIRAAINRVGGLILENYAKNCLEIGSTDEEQEKLKNLISTINKFVK
ncbi:MAG: metal-sensitive transcriptional regulator [Inconstantimicrobium porci]|uniref:Metal-sensitive transcriptional regulator n=1 Tax=Inconstantimicrobium porci TaxID=2652291 RepID=A0A7X2T0G3_9CLOT|nr:metal-sensitive transcriptional regulator [Inconstantimicrobium porci]MDD6770214.1 metal-sensitive transcriptional regulator [Inconstantimicrobium porci]MDY5912510.1 metal-sensitive transcriptional regulator [Inconstantimicrobium porci]MSR89853.1 metal-sensitive transcriptional regulator [Inconstantimicrobium porci]